MSSGSVRLADAADAAAIARVQVASWRDTYPELDAAFWRQFTTQRATRNWQGWMRDGAAPWVGIAGGEVVGFALAREASASADHAPVRDRQLYSIYVLTAYHAMGLGQALLAAALPDAEPAQLWVSVRNDRAIAFYRRNGFVPDGARDDGSTFHGIAALRMVR